MDSFINIVLVNPEIPANTGNIGRTCVGLKAHLHLVGPMGFELSNKHMKRAGLDYWPDLGMTYYPDWDSFYSSVARPQRMFFLSSKVRKSIYQERFQLGDYFVFGPETRGLDEKLLRLSPDHNVTIPMTGPIRSLNLSNAVAIVAYEAFRQILGGTSE